MKLGFSMLLIVLAVALGADPARADDVWSAFDATDTIEITTQDDDGETRETPIWIVVVDAAGYIRTNDSTWLANIRRGSEVKIRAGEVELDVQAEEEEDAEVYDRVEEAFKEKYGWMQRLMSRFRTTRPTVLRLLPPSAAPAE
ncbi:MAG: DUF2255 family protein [Deltaproteobacteria bacterium]|nr:DUF2255 family protein [Deltaproteobacteria bacterium]MBW2392915.1 DUF2255 family protein [Deltaproteobacteria bacterium]